MQTWERRMRAVGRTMLATTNQLLGRFRVPHELSMFLEDEERRSHVWMAYARFALVGIFLILALLGAEGYESWEQASYDITTIVMFLPAAFVQLFAARFERPNAWLKYVIITVDVIMLGYLAATPAPYSVEPGSIAAVEEVIRIYRGQEMQVLFIFYSWVLISLSARFVAYFGFLLWLAWIGQLIGVLIQPDVFTMNELPEILRGAARSVIERHPRYVDPDIAAQNMGFIFVLTLGFIVVIRRTRSLTRRLFKSERSRSSLSRYFSPDTVQRILDARQSGVHSERRDTVILFADLVGFTSEAETLPPDQVFELLREFHGVVEDQVFSHKGTMEKYIGDAVLATFGGLDGGPDDATRALGCAIALRRAMSKLNRKRRARGSHALTLAIGLHYGPTVSGVIGEGRNMAFLVTGAAVAIANRVQAEARRLDADIVLSDAFAARCKNEVGCEDRMKDFQLEPACRLKGLSQPVSLWYRPRPKSAATASTPVT
jgi:adenylate cyclase